MKAVLRKWGQCDVAVRLGGQSFLIATMLTASGYGQCPPGTFPPFPPDCPAAQISRVDANDSQLKIAVKWSCLSESPSCQNPSLVNETSTKDVLWRRHARASQCIWIPQCNVTLRSAAVEGNVSFVSIRDEMVAVGDGGDVVLDVSAPLTQDQEAINVWSRAAESWAQVPKGVVAVSVNKIVDSSGQPIARALAIEGQISMPWLMVADPSQLCQADGRQVAHSLGHVLTLPAVSDLDNLMNEVGSGSVLTTPQCQIARDYVLANLPVLDPPVGFEGGLNDQAYDGLGDVSPDLNYLDVVNTVVIDQTDFDGSVLLCAGLAGVIPEPEDDAQGDAEPLCLTYALDCDNNSASGDNAGLVVPGLDFPGAEFVIEVLIDPQTKNTISILKAATGFGFFIDVELEPGVLESETVVGHLRVCGPSDEYDGPASIPITTELRTTLSAGIVARVMGDGFGAATADTSPPPSLRLQVVTAVAVNSQPVDTGPKEGTVMTFEAVDFPRVVAPRRVAPGQTLNLKVTGMPPSALLSVFAGAFETESTLEIETDEQGEADFDIEIPQGTPLGPTLLTIGVGDQTIALTADEVVKIVDCPADLDGDGQLTINDFLAFQNLWQAGKEPADYDGDSELTVFDFLAYQNAFEQGWPSSQ